MWWSSLFENMRPSDFFNFSFFPKYGTAFVRGIEYTLLLAVVSVLLAVVPALLLALMRLSKNKPIKWLAGAYIAVFRSTPMLVQLSIIYYGLFYAISLPRITLFGFVDISRFIPGVVALALNSSAYVAEIFRAGILAVDKGPFAGSQLVAVHASGGAASGHQERTARTGQRDRYHGEGILHLLCAGHGGNDVRRQDHCWFHRYFPGALYDGGAGGFLHQLPGLQGNRGHRKENASWRQAITF